jgi:ribose 1,5-bisphosphokinase
MGRLVYVMGPSGAGKDAVLGFARERIDGRHPVAFAHRYTTRPPGPGHPNEVSLGPGEFELREGRGLCAFAWAAWGVRYGVGIEVDLWAAHGLVVVVSGSRAHFATVDPGRADLLPVLVTAAPAIRGRRLRARGREDAGAIAERLRRGDALVPAHPALVTIENDGPLAEAGTSLVDLLIAAAGGPLVA